MARGARTSAWSPLAHPLFRALWLASVTSHIGSYMTDVGLGWLMTTLAPSPLLVSLLLTAESLPFFLLGLPAGALADIVDRRRLLIVTQIAMVAVLVMLAIVTLSGAVTPWILLALTFALGTATSLNDPAWHSALPELLPKDQLAAGVTLNSIGINIARTLGPALGGFVVATAGPGIVFVLDSLSFIGVVAVLVCWRRESSPAVLPAERMMGAIRAGLRFARHSNALRRVLLGVFAFMISGAGIMALMPLLARETGHGAVAFGFLLGSFGAGAVAGAVVLPRARARKSADAIVTVGALMLGGVALCASFVRVLAVLCPIVAVGGLAWISVISTLNVAAQHASPPWVKARALAVYLIVFQAGIGGGSAIWGMVATRSSLGTAYVGMAVGLALSALIGSRLKLAAGEGMDHTPARHWPAPLVVSEPSLEAGPIMIQVEYRVDPAHAAEFGNAMRAVGRSHRRNGALQWWLFRDTADPSRFVETWIETTWAEHLRTHERVSVAHRDIEQIARDLAQAGASIEIRHFISAYDAQMNDTGDSLPGVAGPYAT